MDLHYTAASFAIAIASIGGSLAIGNVAGKALDAIARQPEQAANIRATMIIAVAFIEAAILYALVISFMILAK
jgi:F-type H+-transporting ATPase subunit c